MSRLVKNNSLVPIIEDVVVETRKKLANFIRGRALASERYFVEKSSEGFNPDREARILKRLNNDFNLVSTPHYVAGNCFATQSATFYAFKDRNVDAKALAVQEETLNNCFFMHAHQALVVPLKTKNQEIFYLVDVTYAQFDVSYPPKSPGQYLRESETGKGFLEQLLRKGYAVLTPEMSKLYLDSFCKGDCGLNEIQAMTFLKNPPEHSHNLLFSRERLIEHNFV